MTPPPVSAGGLPPALPAREPIKVAVLPLDEDMLFRAERVALRMELAGHLMRLGQEIELVPFPQVDAVIRPVSQKTGARCADEEVSFWRKAQDEGFYTTSLVHVAGMPNDKKGERLWVNVERRYSEGLTFEGAWNRTLPMVDRYRSAFASLTRVEGGAGLLGGLAAWGDRDKNALQVGAVSICEEKNWTACDASSADWKDKAPELAACFPGEDDATAQLLVQGDGGGPYCEMQGLHFTDGREGAREACLCRALVSSMGMQSKPGRRELRIHFEAPDLAGKPRPELRVIETSSNMHAEDNWHSMESVVDGKRRFHSIRRLAVDNIDFLAAPLARCVTSSSQVVVANLQIGENGSVLSGTIVSGAPTEKDAAVCIENALRKGRFACTDDGQAATVQIAIQIKR